MANKAGRSDLVYVEPQSVKAVQQLAAEFKKRENGKVLKKELNAEIKKATRPIEDAMRRNAKALKFRGTSAGQRARRTAQFNKSGSVKKGTGLGLRDSLAAGITTEVSYRAGAGAGVRIRLKSKDQGVNRVGYALNRRGKVRHPTRSGKRFSVTNTDKWADTVASNGKDWFWSPVAKRRDEVVDGVKKAVDDMLNRLARDIG